MNKLTLIVSISLILMVVVSLAQSIDIVGLTLNKNVYDVVDTMYITVTYVLGTVALELVNTINPYTTATVTVNAFIGANLLDQVVHTLTYSLPPALTDTLTGYISTVQGIYTLTVRVVGTFAYTTYDPGKNTTLAVVTTDTYVTLTTVPVGATTTTTITTTTTTPVGTTTVPVSITVTTIATRATNTTETTTPVGTTTTTVVVGNETYTITTWSHSPPHRIASAIYYAPPQVKLVSTTLLLLLTLLLAILLVRRY